MTQTTRNNKAEISHAFRLAEVETKSEYSNTYGTVLVESNDHGLNVEHFKEFWQQIIGNLKWYCLLFLYNYGLSCPQMIDNEFLQIFHPPTHLRNFSLLHTV